MQGREPNARTAARIAPFGQSMPRNGQNEAPSPPDVPPSALKVRRQPRQRTLPALKDGLPRPVLARVESLPAGSWTEEHSHPWAQLSYAVEGVLQVHTATGQFMAPPERAIWVPANLPHEVLTAGPAEMRSLYIRADALDGSPLAQAQGCRVLDISILARELILAVCALPPDYDEHGAPGRLVGVLLDQLAQLPTASLDLPLPTDARLLRLCEALQADPADRRTLAEWGRKIGLTERSMVRLFQQQTGLSVGAWRRRLRLLAALGPLEGGTKVSSVALACGYASASAFISAFCAEFGVTPAQMFTRG